MTVDAVCAFEQPASGGRPPIPETFHLGYDTSHNVLTPDAFAAGTVGSCDYVLRLSAEFNRGANQVFSMSISDALVLSSAVGGVLAVAWAMRALRRVF